MTRGLTKLLRGSQFIMQVVRKPGTEESLTAGAAHDVVFMQTATMNLVISLVPLTHVKPLLINSLERFKPHKEA